MYVSLRNRPAVVADADRPPRRAIPRVVILLGFTSLLTDISSEMITAILPIFLTLQLGLTPVQFGLVDGLYNGVSAVSRLAAGVVSDRFARPKLVASIGYGLSALMKPFLIAVSSVTAVASLISLDRIGKGIRTAPRDAMIADVSDEADLGRNFGVHRAMDNVGAMLGPLVAFAVLMLLPGDFDAVFVVSTVFAVLGLTVLVLLVPKRPGRQTAIEAAAAPDRLPRPRLTAADVKELLRSRRYVMRVGLAGVLTVFTVSDAFLFLGLLERDDNLATYFPLLAVGLAASYALLAVPVGSFADRWGRTRVYVAGHLLLLGAYVTVAGPLPVVPAAVITLILMGLFYATTDGVLSAAVAGVLPEVSRASGLALAQTVVALSAFASSVTFGILMGWLGSVPAFVFMGVGMVLAIAFAGPLLGSTTDGAERS